MRIKHNAPWYDALRSTSYGLLWTKHGIQIVRPGDYIVRAPSGCTWRLKANTVHTYYQIENNPDTLKNFAQKLAKSHVNEHTKDCATITNPGSMCNCWGNYS